MRTRNALLLMRLQMTAINYSYASIVCAAIAYIGEGDLGLATPTPGGAVPPKQSGRAAESRGGKVGPRASQFQAHHERRARALAETVSPNAVDKKKNNSITSFMGAIRH